MTKLTEAQQRERKILEALNEGSEDFGFYKFAGIASRTGLDRRVIRIDVRRLARKGLTVYGRGLWTCDGDLAGSGYAITPAGRAALSPPEPIESSVRKQRGKV